MEYLFYCMSSTPNKIWEDNLYLTIHSKFRSQNKFFFFKNLNTTYSSTTPSKSFYITFVDIFPVTHEKINRIRILLKTQDQARKHDSHLWRYNNWRHRGAKISSYFTSNYLIKRQSETYIIISKYYTSFCFISEIIHPKYVIFNDAKRSWILSYLGWIISILNKNRHGICFIIYYQQQKKSWVNGNKAK